jgi:hypothetical protein
MLVVFEMVCNADAELETAEAAKSGASRVTTTVL